jgi:heme a synthase
VAHFAWATLYFNVAVVLWGAFVRATGSGAGCGNKWPACSTGVLGATTKTQTMIELAHRMTSAIALLMVICLVLWCWRATSKRHWARYSSTLAAIFLVNEALLGAALVLLGHVARDQSAERIFFFCLHFGNTLLLLASLALTAAWLQSGSGNFQLIRNRWEGGAVVVGLVAVLAVGMAGTMAALGDTLFPATSLRASILQDFTHDAPGLLQLRVLHPAFAVVAGAFIIWLVLKSSAQRIRQSRISIALVILVLAEIGIGFLNVLLLVPAWLQILHLLVANAIWIALVLVASTLVLSPLIPARIQCKDQSRSQTADHRIT